MIQTLNPAIPNKQPSYQPAFNVHTRVSAPTLSLKPQPQQDSISFGEKEPQQPSTASVQNWLGKINAVVQQPKSTVIPSLSLNLFR